MNDYKGIQPLHISGGWGQCSFVHRYYQHRLCHRQCWQRISRSQARGLNARTRLPFLIRCSNLCLNPVCSAWWKLLWFSHWSWTSELEKTVCLLGMVGLFCWTLALWEEKVQVTMLCQQYSAYTHLRPLHWFHPGLWDHSKIVTQTARNFGASWLYLAGSF